MNKYQQLAYEFQNAPGSLYLPLPTEPTPLPPWAVDLWRRLITEEKDELIQALESGNIAQIVHEQCDLLYVLYGCAVWMGLDIPSVLVSDYQTLGASLKWYIDPVLEGIAAQHFDPVEYDPDYGYCQNAIHVALSKVRRCSNIDLWPSYQAIHAANMAKMAGGTIYRKDGKIQKPDGWQPANIRAVLEAQGVLLDN